jgi:hypothetical protein
VRWSAVVLGAAAALGAGGLWLWLSLPAPWLRALGLPAAGGSMTPAGHVFFAVVVLLGFVACRFAWQLFRDAAPYQIDAAALGRYRVQTGRITGFGPWLTAGGAYNRYQRIRWQLDGPAGRTGRSPYVLAVYSVWLEPGDRVYIGTDPRGRGRPLFLGVDRAPPAVLAAVGRPSMAELRRAFARHAADSPRWRDKALPKGWAPSGDGQP